MPRSRSHRSKTSALYSRPVTRVETVPITVEAVLIARMLATGYVPYGTPIRDAGLIRIEFILTE